MSIEDKPEGWEDVLIEDEIQGILTIIQDAWQEVNRLAVAHRQGYRTLGQLDGTEDIPSNIIPFSRSIH
tara:strand:+ start:2612 stop:2818 length:207 start_codon:yes stop_codon:yes gene_type:complete